MIKIEIIKHLIGEIELELKMLKEYQDRWREASLKADADKSEKYISAYRYFTWVDRTPSKARIISNLLKVRQLTIEIGKEVKAVR